MGEKRQPRTEVSLGGLVSEKSLSFIAVSLGSDGVKSAPGSDNDEAKHALGEDVQDHVESSFDGRFKHVGTFAKDPHNGVERPQNDGQPSNLSVQLFGGHSVSFFVHVFHQDTDDVEEAQHAEGPEDPFLAACGGGSNDPKSDHKHVDSGSKHNFTAGSSGKCKDVPKHKRSGQKPVNVSDVKKSSSVDSNFSPVGEHGQVSDGGNSSDHASKSFKELCVSSLADCLHVEVSSGYSHAHQTNGDEKRTSSRDVSPMWEGDSFHSLCDFLCNGFCFKNLNSFHVCICCCAI